jgi:hypothetical protein
VASTPSSTKKAARLTQRGKGKRVRFQGGTIFPLVVAVTVVLGLGTIVYARQSRPAADSSPPTINDHWHVAYGFYICGQWYQVQGDLEEVNSQGQFTNTQFLQTGIHSHNDGVIHWHPYTSRAVGNNATLGVFLDVYDVEVSNEKIAFPDNQPTVPEGGVGSPPVGEEFVAGEDQCDGDDAEVQVVVWDSFEDTDDGITYITDFDDIRIKNNGMVVGIAFVPQDTTIPMPPWAADLPALGAADTNQLRPEDLLTTTTVAGSAPAGSTPAPGSTAPASSDAPVTSVTATTAG